MAATKSLGFLRTLPIRSKCPFQPARALSTAVVRPSGILGLENHTPEAHLTPLYPTLGNRLTKRSPKVYPPPPSTAAKCKEPLKALTDTQMSILDPTGARARLFAPTNPEAAKVGDILLVRQKGGDPFAGVCINIRRRGVDTAILLRNELTRVGVEMWYKVYSPNVEGIEVVQRRQKRAKRARLYYMRKPEHDAGSVQNVVTQYIRQRQSLRSGEAKGRDANSHKKKSRSKK